MFADRERRIVVAVLLSTATTVAGCLGVASAGATTHHARGELIVFGETTCAPHWYAPNAGRDPFRVRNRSHHTATIYLVRLPSGRIVGQLKRSRPGTTRRLTVTLKPGSYLWGCDLDGKPQHVSESERVPIDHTYGGPGTPIVPISKTDILGPYVAYRQHVRDLVDALVDQVADLASDLSAGDVTDAESAWVRAHLTWLRIGQDNAAYGAFGELGRRIDGTSAGLVRGESDPKFTGFHKIELDLWRRSDATEGAADAARLVALVNRLTRHPLAHWLPTKVADESGWILRVHEVLEDALRDSLSGNDDYGSGADLESVTADIAATREDLTLLAPLVRPRSPHLVSRARHHLHHLMVAVRATRVNGRWLPLAELTRSERERVNAAMGGSLETVAPIPDLLQIGGQP